MELALDRGAVVDPRTSATLARKLENWPPAEVRAACVSIGKRSRAEGEPAFPTLGILLDELKALSSSRVQHKSADRNSAEIEQFFWEHVDYQMEITGKTEQEVLDGIKQPGFIGRRAGSRPAPLETGFCGRCYEGFVRCLQANGDNIMRKCRCAGGIA